MIDLTKYTQIERIESYGVYTEKYLFVDIFESLNKYFSVYKTNDDYLISRIVGLGYDPQLIFDGDYVYVSENYFYIDSIYPELKDRFFSTLEETYNYVFENLTGLLMNSISKINYLKMNCEDS